MLAVSHSICWGHAPDLFIGSQFPLVDRSDLRSVASATGPIVQIFRKQNFAHEMNGMELFTTDHLMSLPCANWSTLFGRSTSDRSMGEDSRGMTQT